MSYKRPKCKIGFASDVLWYVPKRKKYIATSTIATRDSIYALCELGYDTPNKLAMLARNREPYFIGQEETAIVNEYIRLGYGDLKF